MRMKERQYEAIDRTPFAVSEAAGQAARLLGGEVAAQAVFADAAKAMRLRIEAWAAQRGFRVDGSDLVTEMGGVAIRVPLFKITEATAQVIAMASAPTTGRVAVEPKKLLARLFRSGAKTGDDAFDARWTTTASSPGLAPQLLDHDVREALADVVGWVRATYEDGRITIDLDADAMCGVTLLGGVDVAAALARTRHTTSPFR